MEQLHSENYMLSTLPAAAFSVTVADSRGLLSLSEKDRIGIPRTIASHNIRVKNNRKLDKGKYKPQPRVYPPPNYHHNYHQARHTPQPTVVLCLLGGRTTTRYSCCCITGQGDCEWAVEDVARRAGFGRKG